MHIRRVRGETICVLRYVLYGSFSLFHRCSNLLRNVSVRSTPTLPNAKFGIIPDDKIYAPEALGSVSTELVNGGSYAVLLYERIYGR